MAKHRLGMHEQWWEARNPYTGTQDGEYGFYDGAPDIHWHTDWRTVRVVEREV